MAGNQPHFASASLYVGDLHPDVNETMLFEVFNAVGPVASIRVCRESGTRKSLGYAYVNYHSITDAERALDTLNYTLIRGVPCRIMWSHRDPSLRRSGAGNIFVKNLDKVIDNKALYDTFSLFGNILSCKVATDEHGKSKGYGFVHYESEESGRTAIEKVNNMQIGSKTVYVGPFKRRVERIATSDTAFTNLYVKQFPSEWTEDTLRSIFSSFGEITSVAITTDNVNRRFGFVNYKSPESAPAAIAALHGKRTTPSGVLQSDSEDEPEAPTTTTKNDAATVALTAQRDVAEDSASNVEAKKPDATAAAVATDNPSLDSVENDVDKTPAEVESTEKQSVVAEKSSGEKKTSGTKTTLGQKSSSMTAENRLYVQRAMSKAERINMLKESFNNTHEGKQKQPGVNLYVKNLDVQVSDEVLREAFSKYGTVTSAKVMRDDAGVSKGFGFVCFAFPDEATNAVTGMHLNIFQGKPLYVGLAEKRDHRAARLQQRYRMSNMSNTRTSAHHGVGALADLAPMMMTGQPSNVLPSHMMPYPHPAASTAAAPLYYKAAAATTAPIAQPSIPPSRTALPNAAAAAAAFAGGRPAATAHQMAAAWRHHDVVAPRHSYAMAPAGNIGGATSAPPPPPGAAGSYPSYPLGPSFQQPPAGTTAAAIAANNMAAMGQNFKFTSQARNRQGFPHMHPSSTQGMPGGPHLISPAAPLNNPADVASLLTPSDMSLSAQALAGAHPQLQKQFLGEKLFPLVHKRQPELAGKITGMMLEMDNAELLSLLDSETQLQAKVDEALSVLQRHHQGTTVSSSHRTTATTSTTSALAPGVTAQHQQNVVPPAVDANASPAVATPQ